jgi:alpha-tubulin suppressor-like RCC1 family protein
VAFSLTRNKLQGANSVKKGGLFTRLTAAVPLLVFVGHLTAQSRPNVIAWDGNGIVQTNVPPDLTNAVAVAAGYKHALALRADGTVVAWGDNSYGQTNVPTGLSDVVAIAAAGFHNLALRGDGTIVAWGTNFYGESTVPPGLDHVVGIACGFTHNLALRADGTVVAWGTNYFGSRTVDFGVATVPPGLNNVVAVAAGDAHSMVLRADGTVVSWGAYLALEYWYSMSTPSGLDNVVAIAAGADHCLALKADGTLVAWGNSRFGQQAIPADLSNVVEIAATEYHSLALRADGTVVPFGFYQGVPSGLSNVVAIADGAYSLAIIGSGPPARGPPLVDRAVAEDAGTAIFYAPGVGAWALSYQWQCNGTNLPNATNAWMVLTTPRPIDAGIYSVTVSNRWGEAVTQAGRLDVAPAVFRRPPLDQVGYLWGSATFSIEAQASPPSSFQWRSNGEDLADETNSALVLSNLTRASQGAYSVVISNQFGSALSPAARLWVVNVAGWGNNIWWRSDIAFPIFGGQAVAPATLSNAAAISAGEGHSLALRVDGTVVAWGNNLEGETNVPPGLSNVVAIATGPRYNLALRQDGTVVAWGSAGKPEVPAGLSNVVAIAAGGGHSLALRADGTVVAWGADGSGQADVPSELSNVVAISAGAAHSLALRSDGTVASWGQYQHFDPSSGRYQTLLMEVPIWPGPASDPPQPFTRIGSGASHCLAVWEAQWPPWGWWWGENPLVWGENRYGQSNVPSEMLSDVVAVVGGGDDSLALRADGSVVAWGESSYGQTNVPGDLHNAVAIAAGGFHNLALIGEGPPVLGVPLSNPAISNGMFTLSVPSQSGRVYALQYKNSLDDSLWRSLPLVAGNSGTLTLTDATAATSGTRYYRVIQW